MDIPDFLLILLLLLHLLGMLLLRLKQFLHHVLVFFLVLLGLLGAGQLLDEQNVNNFYELVLDKLVVQHIKDLPRQGRTLPKGFLLLCQ